jgi:hypothetical protein
MIKLAVALTLENLETTVDKLLHNIRRAHSI